MTEKLCPRCAGIEVTWENMNDVSFCSAHLGEVMEEIGREAPHEIPSTRWDSSMRTPQ